MVLQYLMISLGLLSQQDDLVMPRLWKTLTGLKTGIVDEIKGEITTIKDVRDIFVIMINTRKLSKTLQSLKMLDGIPLKLKRGKVSHF